jgi:hypothetical protein
VYDFYYLIRSDLLKVTPQWALYAWNRYYSGELTDLDDCLEKGWHGGVDPIEDAAVLPDELTLDFGTRRQQGSKDGRFGTFFRTQGTLVAGHVSVNVA